MTAAVHAVVTSAPQRVPWVEPGSLLALVEPESLIEAYLRFPPRGFVASLTAAA